MKIFIDTNVMLDLILEREEFVGDSDAALEKAIKNGDRLYFSTSAITDIYYLLHKQTKDKELALIPIRQMTTFLIFADVTCEDIIGALDSDLNDFEDAVIDTVAFNNEADYILTRNIKDFKGSKCRAITPKSFLNMY